MNTLILTIAVLAALLVIASGMWVGAALLRCLYTRQTSSDTHGSCTGNEPDENPDSN